MTNDSFVTTIDLQFAPKLLQGLRDQGFTITKPQYTLFSGKKTGCVCTLYESGKLMVQGKAKGEFIEFFLEPEILQRFDYNYKSQKLKEPTALSTTATSPHIGVDESGKGDFFGPLCIAGVYGSEEQVAILRSMGIRDSKDMPAAEIARAAKAIKKECAHHIVQIGPLKYNEIYDKFKNLNRLLAWGHATVLEQLVGKTGCQDAIIDKFGAEELVLTALQRKGMEINLTQRVRAEEDLIVAAASILARDAFVNGLLRLEKEFGLKLPKGASFATIAAGRKFVAMYGKEELGKVAKLHFKTLDKVL